MFRPTVAIIRFITDLRGSHICVVLTILLPPNELHTQRGRHTLKLQGTVVVSLPIRVANTDGTCNVCDAHNSG